MICRFVAIALLLVSTLTQAAEYRLDSVYSISGRYDDNYRLRIDPVSEFDELSGADFGTQWDFSRNTEISSLTAGLDLEAGAYNIDAYNTFDQRASVSYQRSTQRSQWSVGGSYHNDSTRTTEETIEGSGEFVDADSRSEYGNVNASWFSQLTERNSVNLSLFGQARRNESERLSDYDYAGTSALWQYVLTERFRFQAQLGYNIFESEDESTVLSPFIDPGVFLPNVIVLCLNDLERILGGNNFECGKRRFSDNEQKSFDGQLGFLYLLTERLTLDVLVGETETDTETKLSYENLSPAVIESVPDENTNRSNSNSSYDVNLKYIDENLTYTLVASSSSSANTSGILTQNTRIALDANWQIDARNSFLTELSWFEQESVTDNDNIFSQREQWRARLRYRYRFTEHWSTAAEYRYLTQQRFNIDDRADSNTVLLSLLWSPTDKIW